jgi:hypothetical protein
MKTWTFRFFSTITLIALLSFPAHAAVETTWHREAAPARYKTFDLVTTKAPQGVKTAFGAQVDTIVRREIEIQLLAMGYVKNTGESTPDFRLQYDGSSSEAYAVSEVPQRLLLPFNEDDWVVPQFEALSSSFGRSTLILTVRDGATDAPVWCGWTTEPLKTKKLERRVKKLIQRILSQYPPEGDSQRPRI